MNRARHYTAKVGAVSATVALIGFCIAGASYAQHSGMMHGSAPQQTRQVTPPTASPSPQAAQSKEGPSLHVIHAKQLPAIQEAVAQAIQHLEAGHQQEALAELRQIKVSLETLRQALGKQVGPLFLNDRCPIMGTKINADRVPAELTRVYGQSKVAFCCGGCPAQWDRLTEPQKAAKLKTVAVGSQPTPQGMQGMQGMQHQGMQHQH